MISKIQFSGVAFATLVAMAFLACGGGSDGDSLDKKIKEFEASCDYDKQEPCKKIVEIYKAECNKNNIEACFRLGESYAGEMDTVTSMAGESYDPIQSIALLSKACDANHGAGCERLSSVYEDMDGKDNKIKAGKIKEKAMQIFEKECENGNIDSCRRAGEAYVKGWEIYSMGQDVLPTKSKIQDLHKGLTLLQKYCDKAEKGNSGIHSCVLLGSMFAESKGTTQDYEQAKKYFKKVCDFGAQAGCDAYKKANEKSK